MDKLDEICRILRDMPGDLIRGLDINFTLLQEVRLRPFRPLIIKYNGKEYFVSVRKKLTEDINDAYIVTGNDIRNTFLALSEFSTYAFEEEMRQGYITIAGGHRVGIAGKAVIENAKIKNMKYISFINIRVAGERHGCADRVLPYLFDGNNMFHTLIISPPGAGKTTLLRDIVRQVSNGCALVCGKNVGVVDERSEIAACYHGIPQNDVGIRTDVIDGCPKAEGMMMLVRSMSPDVIAVDEIGTAQDMEAVSYAMTCGCSVIATLHGNEIKNIRNNKNIISVFGRYVILKFNEYGKRQILIYDQRGVQMGGGD